MNNIFSFATGELSQDALICWCFNWYNDDSVPELKGMVSNFLKLIEIDDISKVTSLDIVRQFSSSYKDENGKKQPIKIDVLLIINKTDLYIIEDKTFTETHDNQIERYKNGIEWLSKNSDSAEGGIWFNTQNVGWQNIKPCAIKTVFWKTGFLFDFDHKDVVGTDYYITGENVLSCVKDYIEYSQILNDYYLYLVSIIESWEKNGNYVNPKIDSFVNKKGKEEKQYWNSNISSKSIAQYNLMRFFFPSEMWQNKRIGERYELYQIYNGSSFGRPWTQTIVYSANSRNNDSSFVLFWRIDTDKRGPYLSLRVYSDAPNPDRYCSLSKTMENVINNHKSEIGISYELVKPGDKKNCKEAAIFHLHIGEYLSDWEKNKQGLQMYIREINKSFLQSIKE